LFVVYLKEEKMVRSDSGDSSHDVITSPRQGISRLDIIMPPGVEWTGKLIKDAVRNNGLFGYGSLLDAFLKEKVAHDLSKTRLPTISKSTQA